MISDASIGRPYGYDKDEKSAIIIKSDVKNKRLFT